MTTDWPALDPRIEVATGEPLGDLWERFEVFEALHHSQHICNPMREDELNRVIELIEPAADRSVLDIACGSGEVLLRCHERGTEVSTGVDLSPWMLCTAARRAESRLAADVAHPTWVLADASTWVAGRTASTIVCLGAEWIWHGMVGTIAALASLVGRGGRVVYGGPRLHFDADPVTTTESFGRLDTALDVETRLGECGFELIERIDPGEAGWLDYLERGRIDVHAWRQQHPGPRAEAHVLTQREWADHYAADRSVVGWSVWVAELG